jgi:hypothetical protein
MPGVFPPVADAVEPAGPAGGSAAGRRFVAKAGTPLEMQVRGQIEQTRFSAI